LRGQTISRRAQRSHHVADLCAACCSGGFTGTKRIAGRVTASQIASAALASVLPRFT